MCFQVAPSQLTSIFVGPVDVLLAQAGSVRQYNLFSLAKDNPIEARKCWFEMPENVGLKCLIHFFMHSVDKLTSSFAIPLNIWYGYHVSLDTTQKRVEI